MSVSFESHHAPNVKLYIKVFAALMVLTVVTVAVSYIHLNIVAGVALGLAIATLKAGLVAAYFMHLKGEKVLILALLAVTIFFMLHMFVIPGADVALIADQMKPGQATIVTGTGGH